MSRNAVKQVSNPNRNLTETESKRNLGNRNLNFTIPNYDGWFIRDSVTAAIKNVTNGEVV